MDPERSRRHSLAGMAEQRGGLDRALARASDAPLREGNRSGDSRNGPDTYEDWLAAIAGASVGFTWTTTSSRTTRSGRGYARPLISKAEEA